MPKRNDACRARSHLAAHRCWILLVTAALAGCSTAALQPVSKQASAPTTIVYVTRRGWHIDIGFSIDALDPPLAELTRELPGAGYLIFGFGDKRYLLAKNKSYGGMLAALWPGDGLSLVTGLVASPEEAFGAENVVQLRIDETQAHAIENFLRNTLLIEDEVPQPFAMGPYEGSLYFSTGERYSVVHTCNTWAAEALASGSLPIRSSGVIFAAQLWRRVREVAASNPP